MPAVVWLHSFSYATGYSRYAKPHIEKLVAGGFAVLAFDQIGFGTRIHQSRLFYARYPKWSLMGKMVCDTVAAVDSLAQLSAVDVDRIFLVGAGMGARVALYTASEDPRVSRVALLGGLAMFRSAPDTEGLKQFSHLHGLIPKMGHFVGLEKRLPADDPDVLALLAPRPVLVIAPEFDRYSKVADIRAMVKAVQPKFGEALRLSTPRDFHRFPPATFDKVVEWLQMR